VGKQGGEGVHRDDLQNYWHQKSLVVLHMGNMQAPTNRNKDL
jgi:hypothetical protein